jgi:N-acyl-D-amino-acid deacylase
MTDLKLGTTDLLIVNACIIDGSGAPRFYGAVSVLADKITGVFNQDQPQFKNTLELLRATSKCVFDAKGQVLSPGFIDAHTHDDRLLLSHPQMTPKVSQGVTTVVAGNCGISLAPMNKHLSSGVIPPLNLLDETGEWFKYKTFSNYIQTITTHPSSVNCAFLVGHTSLRVGVMSDLTQAASAHEIELMRAHVVEALEAGAIGVSTGLYYEPAFAASAQEVIEVCRPLAKYGGLYCTHMRDEGDGILSGLDESFLIARELEVPLIISHLKVVGMNNYGKSPLALAHIQAHQKNQEICFDCYPYPASSTILSMDRALTASKVIVTWSKAMPQMAGKELTEIAQQLHLSIELTIQTLHPAGAIYFRMDEGDVQNILKHPEVMIGSDGLPHDEFPHPRLWGSFTKVLGHYSRDLGLFPLESAVRKMTSVTAKNFRLQNRGEIKAGFFADLTLFDPLKINAKSSYESPLEPSQGIIAVWVNGEMVFDNGSTTGKLVGRVLKHESQAVH